MATAQATTQIETPSGKGAGDENFPVGSWLLPRALRPHVAHFYAFARAIDDIADNPALAPAEKVRRLRAGETPIYEPGLEDLLARNRERMHFDTDLSGALAQARLLFVAVGTPPTYSGDADLSAVNAVEQVAIVQ